MVRPDAAAILPKLAWHYDEPFADSSAVPTYYVAQMTREHVTVALNGDAGDESFGGYDRYVANLLAASFDRWPGAGLLRHAIRFGLHLLPRSGSRTSLLYRGRRFLDGLTETPERRYARWFCHFYGDRKAELCTPEFLAAAGEVDALEILLAAYRESDAPDFGDATLGVDVGLYLPDDLLVKVDIASMAHSLEARSPFLDHEFMEFAATIPFELKVRGRVKKYILKRALAGLLPDQILHRPKMGFGVPDRPLAAPRTPGHGVRHAALVPGRRPRVLSAGYRPTHAGRACAAEGGLALSRSGRSSCWSCGTAPTSTGMEMSFATARPAGRNNYHVMR